MKIKIDKTRWYAEKARFIKLYKDLGYRWDKNSNKWVSPGGTSYLLVLEMDGEFKRFDSKDCSALANFILSIGGQEDGVVVPKKDEVYTFHGADLWAHYRTQELLRDCPDDFGVIWK